MHTHTQRTRLAGARPSRLAVAVLAALALAGCSSAQGDTPVDAADEAAGLVTVEDAWVKAAESGMSAAFGTLENTGTSEVVVTSVSSPTSPALELHETVDDGAGQMVMREREGGFAIPAGGSLVLEPGGNHIMLMELTDPLLAGDEVTFTLTFSDDSQRDFTAPVKDYSGANETYHESDSGSPHGSDGHESDHSGAGGGHDGSDDGGSDHSGAVGGEDR